MEDITEPSEPMQKFGKVDSSGRTCMETRKNSGGVAQDVKTREYQFPRRNATKEQSQSGYLRRLGSRLHGSFLNVGIVRVHLGGSGLCVQVG